MKITVFGSTGLVGSDVIELAYNSYPDLTLCAPNRRKSIPQYTGVSYPIVNFSELEQSQEIFDADSVICCIGTTLKKAGSKQAFYEVDYTLTAKIASLASARGVRSFILISSLGANPNSSFFYLKTKGEIERFVEQLSFDQTYILRPSGLLGNRKEVRLAEELGNNLSKLIAPLLVGPMKKYRPIHAKTVAKAALHCTLEGRRGFHILESDILQSFS